MPSGLPRRGQRAEHPFRTAVISGVRAAVPQRPCSWVGGIRTPAQARAARNAGANRGHRYRHGGRTPGRSRGLRRGWSERGGHTDPGVAGRLATLAAAVAAEQADAIVIIADRYEATRAPAARCSSAATAAAPRDAQHVATEYVVRYQTNRPAMRVALTTDTSLLTPAPNDWAFEESVRQAGRSLAEPGDLLCCIRRQGESQLVRAAQAAKARGVGVVALLDESGGQPQGHRGSRPRRARDRDGAHSGAASRDRARDL